MHVIDVTARFTPPDVTVEAAPAYELLLSFCAYDDTEAHAEIACPSDWSERLRALTPPDLLTAVEAFDAGYKKIEMRLLGLAYASPPPKDVPALLTHIAALDPLDLTRMLRAESTPDYEQRAIADLFHRAMTGDHAAQAHVSDMLAPEDTEWHAALTAFLARGPDETKQQLLTLLRRWYDAVFSQLEAEIIPDVMRRRSANLGIERIVTNVTANAAIRFLLLCGKDSHLFRPGQTLSALVENGVDETGEIIGAQGYHPVVRNLPRARIDAFRRQIELVDWTDKHDADLLRTRIADLAAPTPGPFLSDEADDTADSKPADARPHFAPIRLGGTRTPLTYDPKGFFVITADRSAGEIVVRHYLPDNTPAHEARGRNTESLFLALIREGLVSQLSHAAYLGAELAKAEASLRLGARYTQDQPLRAEAPSLAAPDPSLSAAAPPRQDIPLALTWEQFGATAVGEPVNVAVSVTEQTKRRFAGTLAEPREENPFQSFRHTAHPLAVRWGDETRIAMGTAGDIAPGAPVRVRGVPGSDRVVDAAGIAIITAVATIE